MKTYGEQFKSAIACKTKDDARIWLDEEIAQYQREYKMPAQEAKKVILSNLGYMAGYYDQETATKVLELFGAAHPILGTDYFGKDPMIAFAAGGKRAEQANERDK